MGALARLEQPTIFDHPIELCDDTIFAPSEITDADSPA
jgi:hypothetical protein